MKLRFGKADHGWLPTTLELDDGPFPFDISYTPYDFIDELIAALSGVLGGKGEYVARICEEPAEHEWRFRSFDGATVLFDVVTYRDGRHGGVKGEITVKESGPALDVVLPFWRGLRELAGRAQAEGFRSHWRSPFPFEALDRLTARIEAARGRA